jgi:hypothetical protein
MKRKLIDFDVFKKIQSDSLSHAECELAEASDVLAHSLGKDDLALHCYGESHVLYETLDDTYVYASYTLDENALTLEGIEELVVDEEDEQKHARETLSGMVEQLIEGNEMKAHDLFADYVKLPYVRRNFKEAVVGWRAKEGGKKVPIKSPKKKRKASWKAKKAARNRSPEQKRRSKLESDRRRRKAGLKMADEQVVGQINAICENVLEYVDFREVGPALKQSAAKYDDHGNVVALRIPTSRVRNEGKILSFNWKTLNHEVKVLRDGSKKLAESVDFCKTIAELKRQNAFEDAVALEENLDTIVSRWPEVVYLTEEELSKMVGEALEIVDVSNYDDQVCQFMAEGILRTAHRIHKDRVDRVLKLADATDCKEYECFQEAAAWFYPRLDETNSLEMQVFHDLQGVVGEIYKEAARTGDQLIAEEAERHLKHLYAVVEGEVEPDLKLAEIVAMWATTLLETNLETSEWNPSNSVHITLNGDNPRMAQIAGVPYTPKNDFSGDWGDSAPVSDGKNYKGGLASNMRSRSWGNVGDPETDPSLRNPYLPKPTDNWTMKGEPGVDKNSDKGFGQIQGETWPGLTNPYLLNAETPQSYKMNHGKEADLVVDQ